MNESMESELLKSHDELQSLLRLAAIALKKRNLGRQDSPLLQLMHRKLQESRVVSMAATQPDRRS
jgi:hypothetical protein